MVGWVGGKCEDGLLGHCPLIDYPRSNGRAARLSGQIHKRYFTLKIHKRYFTLFTDTSKEMLHSLNDTPTPLQG